MSISSERSNGLSLKDENRSKRIQLPVRERTEPKVGGTSRPSFSSAGVDLSIPAGAEVLDHTNRAGTEVRVLSVPGTTRIIYHIVPWEHSLSQKEQDLIAAAVNEVRLSPPSKFLSTPEELREFVRQAALRHHRLYAQGMRQESFVATVVRYTVGLGMLEHLLTDDRVEDVYLDAPVAENHWHVTLGGVSGMKATVRAQTNITAAEREAQGLVARLRQHSLKPFSEAIPVLETDVPGHDARATVLGPPMSPHGLALAFRRHSRRPWTLLRLVQQGCLDAHTAALLSFLVDGRSTILVCGPRGAGKSSLLSALMFEFSCAQRMIAIEDTLELPVRRMQQMGFKVQSIHVQPSLDHTIGDATDDALRVSLRLGESALILGEVRGQEAKTLYESMRTGKAGSAVLGTIHGDSARSVYERAVHDMGVAPEAFQATDVVLTLGLVRPNGGQRQERRLVEVAEVDREKGPGNFAQLMPLLNGGEGTSACIGRVAKDWGISYDEAMEHIELRAEMRRMLLEEQANSAADLIGPEAVLRSNEFLWERMESGKGTRESFLAEFRSMVQGWS
ncbi:MAG: hypothetical protein A4E32_01627 [Methanomassiliicoccales archaeon PtaU1.Bin124]|nr:MAG: hypothetical protein A4E32_01627 [Methanomassiliicoccales archaeon PtaU1.Bin124]